MSNIIMKFDIYGAVNTIVYQQAKILTEFLNNKNSEYKAQLNPMDPFEFSEYKTKLKQQGRISNDKLSLVVIVNDNEITDFNDFLKWVIKNAGYKDEFPEEYKLEMFAHKEQDKFLIELQKKHPLLYLDITIEDRPAGQFIIKLFHNKCPKTSKWFYDFFKKNSEISYNGVKFERLVHNGWIQSGEFQQDGVRIIDNIPIENFVIPHSSRGIVSLCNLGPPNPTENSSPFMIQFKENPFFNKKYVAFGKLVFGDNLLDQIEKIPTRYEKPINEIRISNTGVWQSENESNVPPEYKEFIDEVKPEVLRNWFIKTNEVIHYTNGYKEKIEQQKQQQELVQQANEEADSLIIEYL